jgi:molecular chaperone GrpE (heat shock protein)
MARGWESKSVESQVEEAEARRIQQAKPQLTQEQAQFLRERESLELSRTRVSNDLQSALNPRYRAQLEESLRFLDAKLAALKGNG